MSDDGLRRAAAVNTGEKFELLLQPVVLELDLAVELVACTAAPARRPGSDVTQE